MNDKEYFHVIELTHLQGEISKYSFFYLILDNLMKIDQKKELNNKQVIFLKFIQNEYQKILQKLKKLT